MDRSRLEMVAVLFTGALKLVMVDQLGLKFWFITGVGVLWICYAIFRANQDPHILRSWGVTVGFSETSQKLAMPASGLILLFFAYGYFGGTAVVNWHIVPVLLLYPLWGIVQQWLVLRLFGENLKQTSRISNVMLIIITASLFAVVHLPSIPLVAATFVLAIVYCHVYFQFHNILIPGILHGWLACFFYFFVLGRDPWVEFVSAIAK